MNSTSQLDPHPDAERLNAFVEQALGAAEREQVLSHLAGCSRCREVVFLVQAVVEVESPSMVAASSAAVDRPWFANWRWALVPAAALVAVVALAVTFYPWSDGFRPKHAAVVSETAKVDPENVLKAPVSAAPEPGNAEATHAAVPPVALKPPARSAQPAAPHAPLPEAGQLPATPSTEPLAPSSFHGESYAPLSTTGASGQGGAEGPAVGGQANAVLFKPQPESVPWPQVTLQKRMTGAPARSTATTQVARTLNFAAAMPRSDIQPVAANSLEVSMKRPIAPIPVLSGISSINLPSGAMSTSVAVTSHQTLAVDRAGTLFLSEDAGLHWEHIAQQWTGRAIEVRAAKAASNPVAPAEAFELMNEAGLTWVSADGKVWKKK